MPTSTSGSPSINTGNAAWDQGLGSIFGGLFPDPSKIAQAGYYGAEQRNKQLQSSKLRDQMARQQAMDTAASTLTMPTTSYAPSTEGPNMPPIMQPPGSYVPSQAPPAAAPPPTLGATVAGAANGGPAPAPASAPAPPSAAPPAAGMVGANMAPGGLSSLFAQGGGAVPDGSGTVRLDQGTPPPVSSPAAGAGAPPASNATATDGSVPTNDAVSGIFHPGSITPPGGGRKTSGPANSDGSPAKPIITAAQYVNLAVSAGHDAQQALLDWRAMISSAYDTGRIDENTYHHMMGAADPAIITTDATNTANIKRTGMEQAGQTQREAMSQTGQTQRTQMTTDEQDRARGDALVDTVDDQGNKTLTPRRDLKPGQPGYDPTLANTRLSAAVAPVTTQPGGAGTDTFSSTTADAQKNKTRLHQGGTDVVLQQQRGATGLYVDPKNPTQLINRTFDDAQREGLVVAPKTQEEWQSLAQSAAANAPTLEEGQRIRDRVLAMAPPSIKPMDAKENVRNSNIIDRQLELQMPVPARGGVMGGAATNMNAAGSSPELNRVLADLTDQYFYKGTGVEKGNRTLAANAAISQLIKEGYIDPKQNDEGRSLGFSPLGGAADSTTITKDFLQDDGSIGQRKHFRIDLMDPKHSGQPFPRGQVPKVRMSSLSSDVAKATDTATKSTMAQPKGQPLGPAPPNAQDGDLGTSNTGQRMIMWHGQAYPAPGG